MLQVREYKDKLIGHLADTNRLNASVAPEVGGGLTDTLTPKGVHLILNLSNINFLDSTGIGTLISALKTARQSEGTFQLCCIRPEVMSLLKLMKLDMVFDIFDSEEDIK